MRSEMVTKLLAYILVNSSKAISVQELIDVLWVDDEVNNPVGALKNLVYRLRNVIKECLGEDSFIISSRGNYGWNNDIPMVLDIEQVEELYHKSKQTLTSKKNKKVYLQQVVSGYKSGIFKAIVAEHWAIRVETYYRKLYLNAVEDLIKIYEEAKDYSGILNLVNHVISVEPLEENLYYYKVKAMLKLQKRTDAYECYKESKAYLCEKLGIVSPKKLESIYAEFPKKMQSKNSSIEDIDIEMNRKTDRDNKTFMCDYNVVFREIYRLEQRRIRRLGISEYMVLFTVNQGSGALRGDKVAELLSKAAVILGDAIETSLRSGDIASRCSELQYVALLPNCPENMVSMVASRILDKYEKEVTKQNLYIKFKRAGISIDYTLKDISSGIVKKLSI
jgi:DNA-binding SARP family transcriptional activator